MSNWIQLLDKYPLVTCKWESLQDKRSTDFTALLTPEETPPCGTVACIAGWASILCGNAPYEAVDASRLCLSLDEQHRLFYVTSWPMNFGEGYTNAKTPEERASITADRIDHFIKTNGLE